MESKTSPVNGKEGGVGTAGLLDGQQNKRKKNTNTKTPTATITIVESRKL